MVKISTSFTLDQSVLKNIDNRIQLGNKNCAQAIVNNAIMRAPIKTGALRYSGRVEQKKLGEADAVFGGGKVPYAYRRHFENNKNPQTRYYLSKAAEHIASTALWSYYKI